MKNCIFSIGEEIKCKAYKELIQELEKELEDKPKEIERLEIEYFKKWLLNEAIKNKYSEELNHLMEKIAHERYSNDKLKLVIESLRRFEVKYGK